MRILFAFLIASMLLVGCSGQEPAVTHEPEIIDEGPDTFVALADLHGTWVYTESVVFDDVADTEPYVIGEYQVNKPTMRVSRDNTVEIVLGEARIEGKISDTAPSDIYFIDNTAVTSGGNGLYFIQYDVETSTLRFGEDSEAVIHYFVRQ